MKSKQCIKMKHYVAVHSAKKKKKISSNTLNSSDGERCDRPISGSTVECRNTVKH